MQCGTEPEIKERHRQTERWVGGGRVHWGDTETERRGERQRWRGEKGREWVLSFLLIWASFPSHHHFCSALLRHCLDPKKNRQLNYHSMQICMPAHELMCFCLNVRMQERVCKCTHLTLFHPHTYTCVCVHLGVGGGWWLCLRHLHSPTVSSVN